MKRVFVLLLLLCASAASFAQSITSGSATFTRTSPSSFDATPTANFAGVTAGPGDQVFEFGWWYRVSGDTAETPFPLPTSQSYVGDTSTITWTNVNGRGFDAQETCVVLGIASPIGGKVTCTMRITNPGTAALGIDVFVMTDVDLGGTAASDSVTVGIPQQRLDLTDGSVSDTAQFAGIGASALLVRPFGATTDVAGLLSDTLVTNFDNSGVPATNFDFTGGFQWSTMTVPAGGSRDVVTVVAFNTTAFAASADLAITKTDGVTSAAPGASVTYTITASNAGPDASGAVVADTFPASLTCTWTCVGAGGGTCSAAGAGNLNDTVNLPVGGSVSYTASCVVSSSAIGSLSNTATVTSTGGTTDPAPGNNSATDTDTLTPTADISITKTDGVTFATAGGSVTYTVTAANAGPSDANGVFVDDMMPATLTCNWTCVGAGGGTCTASGAGNINDTVNLPAGASVIYTAACAVSPSATSTIVNTATVSPPPTVVDPNSGNNAATDSDTVMASADLSITKTDGVTTATAGGSVTYTIVASNAGPSNAPSANVSDTFPASLTCTWTCAGAGGGTCAPSGAGNINDTPNLPAGGSVTYTAACAVSPSATGSLVNTATVGTGPLVTDPNVGNNSATDTDALGSAADLSVTISDSPDPVTSGAQITYAINTANAGPSDASAAVMTITTPANTTFVSLASPGWSCTAPAVGGSGTVTCNLASYPSSGTANFTLVVAVASTFTGTVSATANITASTTDTTPGNNSASASTLVNALPVVVSGVVSGSGGTISCASPVASGSTTTCVITPAPGFGIGSVSGCGGVTGTTSPYTTGVITSACTVTATFASLFVAPVPATEWGVIVLLTLMLGVLGARRRRAV